jgi:ferredoxin--NADP+ reductase
MNTTGFIQATLVERTDFSEELALFRFSADTNLSFVPGQYATIAVERQGKLVQRPYSIASSPLEPFLEFFIELVPDGELTPLLWELTANEKVFIRNRIVGRFTLDDSSGVNKHLMLATVTGVAPFISMARTQRINLDRGAPEPHHLAIVHAGSHSSEFGTYREELTDLSRGGWLSYVPTVSRPWTDADWKGETGRVEDVIRKYSDELGYDSSNAVAYACGHPQMIENAKGILTRRLFPKERLREEKYFVG